MNLSYAGEETVDGKTYDKLALSFEHSGPDPGRPLLGLRQPRHPPDGPLGLHPGEHAERRPALGLDLGRLAEVRQHHARPAPHAGRRDDRKLELGDIAVIDQLAGLGVHLARPGEVTFGRPSPRHLAEALQAAVPWTRARRPTLVAGKGLAGNANQGGRRQVILLPKRSPGRRPPPSWETTLDPAARRGNLLLSGIASKRPAAASSASAPRACASSPSAPPANGWKKPVPGLKAALRPHWRAGACAEVIEGGEIRVGDEVAWEEERQMGLELG